MPREIKRKCKHCGKTMKRIKNDWDSRKYHKKCFEEIDDIEDIEDIEELMLVIMKMGVVKL